MYRQSEKVVKQHISSTYLHNMANFGPLTVEIGSGVWGTPANFNWFHVLPSLLQRRRSPEANQTLHDVWPSPGIGSVIARHSSSGRQSNFAACYKEWNHRTFAEGATYIRLGGHHRFTHLTCMTRLE